MSPMASSSPSEKRPIPRSVYIRSRKSRMSGVSAPPNCHPKPHRPRNSSALALSRSATRFTVFLEKEPGALASPDRIRDHRFCMSSSETALHLSKKFVIQSSSTLPVGALESTPGIALSTMLSMFSCFFVSSSTNRCAALRLTSSISIPPLARVIAASASACATRRI